MEHLADSDVYSERVVAIFDAPAHAGPPKGTNRVGEAESRSRASRVRLHLRIGAGCVEAAGFEVLGCPHAIAAAELVCERLRGCGIAALENYDAGFLDEALPLPAGKLDIRLLLEDAVRDCARGE